MYITLIKRQGRISSSVIARAAFGADRMIERNRRDVPVLRSEDEGCEGGRGGRGGEVPPQGSTELMEEGGRGEVGGRERERGEREN